MSTRERTPDDRNGNPGEPASGTTGVGRTDETDVSLQQAAEEINPGDSGPAAADPREPDTGRTA